MIPEGAVNWRITLSLKANTRCKVDGECRVEDNGILAETLRAPNGLLSGVRLSCLTERSLIPQITIGATNKIVELEDPNRDRLVRAALRFEGIFAPFGMINLDFAAEEWAWHCYLPSDDDPKLYFSYSSGSEESPVRSESMEINLVSTLTRMALKEEMNEQSLTLTLFREGENHFQDYRYIDAIRSFYLSIEHQCAAGKTGRNATIEAFKKSKFLVDAVADAGPLIRNFIRKGDLSQSVAHDLFFEKDFSKIIEWIYLMRGGLFHQSNKRRGADNWNPSNHIPHKAAAIVIRAVCAGVAHQLAFKSLDNFN
ncbi:MAG: hypothetical protein JWL86_2915 [Rhizobium sp.]|nr:hypothetical protein [Rhizobium sp.]